MREPLSISGYAILFIVLILGLFALVSGLAWGRMEAARERIEASNAQAAVRELEQALSELHRAARDAARQLADWDETRQQLATPTYYTFWREYRLSAPDVLPAFVLDAEIYDAAGRALAREHTGSMPQVLNTEDLSTRIRRVSTGAEILVFAPVLRPGEDSALLGYLGVRLDPVAALLELHHFRYLAGESLRLELPAGSSPLSADDTLRYLHYRLVDNPESELLQQAMTDSLLDIALLVGLLSALFYLLLVMLLAVPLRRLSRHIDALSSGGGGLRLGRFLHTLPVAELEKVRVSLNEYQSQLDQMHRNLRRKNRELWDLAHVDALTGVHNRRAFEQEWRRIADSLRERSRDLTFILYDCNHFKAINDTYGHPVGDEVIRLIATALQRSLRQGDRLYRLGGDEFATLLTDCAAQDAQQVARRCVEAVAATEFRPLGIEEPVRISVGMSHAPHARPGDLEPLQRQADTAMYHAKRPGRPPVMTYADSMSTTPSTLFSSMVTTAVYEVLATGAGLQMHYQPVVELEGGGVSYYEALARIRHRDELLTPYSIFPLVEARNLETDFDAAVLEQVVGDLRAGLIMAGTGVAVNLSGPALLHHGILERLGHLRPFLGDYKILLEVTETAFITQLELAGKQLSELRDQGFLIALDDFGSGYSSLRYLANMPIDLVKFDISMIRTLTEDVRQGVLLEDLARLILRAGYTLVAEGIEDDETREKVRAVGFRYGQGYLFGKPRPASGEG